MSATTPLPTDEQRQRAKWDLLLADLEYRQDQMRLARADLDHRQSQMRLSGTQDDRLRQEMRLAPWVLVAGSTTAGAALFAAAFAFAKLFT